MLVKRSVIISLAALIPGLSLAFGGAFLWRACRIRFYRWSRSSGGKRRNDEWASLVCRDVRETDQWSE
jgi:hypothetical protein